MKKLNLTEYAQLAEIIAAIAVVISLIYVGVQLKANTDAVRSVSIQEITNTSVGVLGGQVADPEISRIRRLGNEDLSSLTADEVYRYHILQRQIWLTFHNVYLQRNLQVIGSELWSTYERIICREMLSPGVVETWSHHSHVLDPGFVIIVEACPRFKELAQ